MIVKEKQAITLNAVATEIEKVAGNLWEAESKRKNGTETKLPARSAGGKNISRTGGLRVKRGRA